MADELSTLYTLQEVSKHFKVSERTLHRWLDSGKLFGMLIERQWRFTPDAIQAKEKASLRVEGQKGARKKRTYTRRTENAS